MVDPVKIDGLVEFSRNLKRLDADLPKALRIAMNEAANVVVRYAKPKVPRRTGRAAGSIKARSTRTAVRVVGGGTRVPYYPWLDWGGRVGRRKSIRRVFMKDGRYIYKGYFENKAEFQRILEEALVGVAESAGIEVD